MDPNTANPTNSTPTPPDDSSAAGSTPPPATDVNSQTQDNPVVSPSEPIEPAAAPTSDTPATPSSETTSPFAAPSADATTPPLTDSTPPVGPTPTDDGAASNWNSSFNTPSSSEPSTEPSTPPTPEPAPSPIDNTTTDTPVPPTPADNSTAPTSEPAVPPWSIETPTSTSTPVPSAAPESTPPDPLAGWSGDNTGSTFSSPSPEQPSAPATPTPTPSESIPTDLSHLAAATSSEPVIPGSVGGDTLVVPTAPEATSTISNASKGFPKWILIAGGLILLVVIGGSAYFILGGGKLGQPSTTSIPAEQPPLANPPQQLIPTESPAVTETSSTGFGGLNGSEATPGATEATSSSKTPTAMELLIQQKSVTPTP